MTHQASGTQDCGTVRFRLQRPLDGYALTNVTEHRDGFFIASGASWFDTMQRYRAVHDAAFGRAERPSPDPAWEPVLAPWGAPRGRWGRGRDEALGPDELWEMARVAAGLGIRGFINWGNWCRDYHPEFNIPALTWGFPDFIGDFVPSRRFPDFRAFVGQLRELGFMSICWISPWLVGRRTRARQRLAEAVVELDTDPATPGYDILTSYLCPRHPRTQEYVVDLVAGVMREYGLDGFTVDMVDSAPIDRCVARHEHNYDSVGLAMADTFGRIRAAIDAVNPNAVVEFRPQYSNISNLYNATAHRSVDSGEAGSYDMNRRQCLILRSYVPPGVAVHFDPQWWHRDERNETVAKMLATMVVCSVPQIGADILNLTDEHRRLVAAWLAFYHEHKEDFRHGRMRPVQNDALFSTIKVERGRKAFVHFASYPALKVPLDPAAEEIYLVNCTNEASLYTILLGLTGAFVATVHDYDLTPRTETRLQAQAGALLVDLAVPEGGLVVLRRASA